MRHSPPALFLPARVGAWRGVVGLRLTSLFLRSPLPDRRLFGPFGSPAVLRQQPVWNRSCPRTCPTDLWQGPAASGVVVLRVEERNSQPSPSFKQNGNLTNTPHLNYYLDHYAHRHINTSSDSELLLNLLADALQKTGKFRIDADDIFRAVREIMQASSGAYACTMMIAGYGIIGFRDPNGIRPLGWARRKSEEIEGGWDYLMASESVVCDALGFTDWKDVAPGAFPRVSLPSVSRSREEISL